VTPFFNGRAIHSATRSGNGNDVLSAHTAGTFKAIRSAAYNAQRGLPLSRNSSLYSSDILGFALYRDSQINLRCRQTHDAGNR
jgi:hypothetical protein